MSLLPSSKLKVLYLHGVTFDETKFFYECPQLHGESSFEVESFESLESSFVPFIQEPSHVILGTLDTFAGTSLIDILKFRR